MFSDAYKETEGAKIFRTAKISTCDRIVFILQHLGGILEIVVPPTTNGWIKNNTLPITREYISGFAAEWGRLAQPLDWTSVPRGAALFHQGTCLFDPALPFDPAREIEALVDPRDIRLGEIGDLPVRHDAKLVELGL